MKNLERMNVVKDLMVLLLFCAISSFSQKKEDVYFLLDKNNCEYLTPGIFDDKIDFINIVNRKEYEYHQEKVKEAKSKGLYYFDPESGRDNLGIHVPKLTFEIISRKQLTLTTTELSNLKLIDYTWIKENSWKKIAKQPYNYRNIYFLHKTDTNKYIRYHVGLTIIDH